MDGDGDELLILLGYRHGEYDKFCVVPPLSTTQERTGVGRLVGSSPSACSCVGFDADRICCWRLL